MSEIKPARSHDETVEDVFVIGAAVAMLVAGTAGKGDGNNVGAGVCVAAGVAVGLDATESVIAA